MMIGQQYYAASVTTMKVETTTKVYTSSTAQFMIVVDFTIVQVALPSIGRKFSVSTNA